MFRTLKIFRNALIWNHYTEQFLLLIFHQVISPSLPAFYTVRYQEKKVFREMKKLYLSLRLLTLAQRSKLIQH